MDGIQQMGLPILGIVAVAALTFYAVSFNEIREVNPIDLFFPFCLNQIFRPLNPMEGSVSCLLI